MLTLNNRAHGKYINIKSGRVTSKQETKFATVLVLFELLVISAEKGLYVLYSQLILKHGV